MADDDWAGATFGKPTATTDDEWEGATFQKRPTRRQALEPMVPERPPPGLLGAGMAGLAGDAKTVLARGAHALNMRETAADLEKSAEESYARQAQRPLAEMPDDLLSDPLQTGKAVYEQSVASVPSMVPVLGGALAGGKMGAALGPWGALAGGIAGGTLAGWGQMTGSNLRRQMEEGKIPLEQTQAMTAAGTALFQSALDSLVPGGAVTGGIGRAAGKLLPPRVAASAVSRVAAAVIGAGATEGMTEAAQQWLEILQANPQKAMDMPPEVRKELRDSGIVGFFMGGIMGAAGGARRPQGAAPSTPTGVEPPAEETPPETEYWADRTGLPGEAGYTGLGEPGRREVQRGDLGLEPLTGPTSAFRDMVPEDLNATPGWIADGRGLPRKAGEVTPEPVSAQQTLDSGYGLPEPELPYLPNGKGLPGELEPPPEGPPPWAPNTSVMGQPPGMPEQNGPQVFAAVNDQLRAAGMNRIQAAANARMWQARFETLGKQLGRDPMSLFREWNVVTHGPNLKDTLARRVKELEAEGMSFREATIKASNELDQTFKQFEQQAQKVAEPKYTTPEFKDWFADSKVTNEGGTPLVLYHGTSKDADFGRFKVGRHGAWFTTDPASASQYAVENDSMGYTWDGGKPVPKNTASRVYPVNLKIENPYRMNEADFAALRKASGDSPMGYKRAQAALFDRLRREGYDGADFGGGTWVVLKNPNQIKSVMNKGAYSARPNILEQRGRLPNANKTQVPQANITFQPDGTTVIRLFRTANASSFMHESAHLFLEQMIHYAPQNVRIAQDLRDVMDWFGVKDPSEIERKHHEMFARGFEKYLRTGKAPNKSLLDLFKQFAEWLKAIYTKASELDVQVPDYVNKVYDRLLSTKENNPEAESTPMGVERQTPNTDKTFHQSQRDEARMLRQFDTALKQRLGDRFDAVPREVRYGDSTYADIVLRVPAAGGVVQRKPTGITVRFASHGQYHGHGRNIVSIDPITGNTEEKVLDVVQYFLTGKGPAPRVGLSFMDPKTQVERRVQATYDRAAAKAGVNPFKYADHEVRVVRDPRLRTFEQAAPNTSAAAPNPTNRALNWLQRVIYPEWMQKGFDTFSNVKDADQYRDLRNIMTGATAAAEKRAYEAKSLFDKMTLAEKNAANSFMETAGADPMTLPASVRGQIVALKDYINGPLKRQLINSGLLPESVLQKNVDSYLPRLYLKFILDQGGAKGARLDRDYVKHRGDKELDELLAMGEIKDPSVRAFYALFRPLRDLKIMEFLDQISRNKDWVIPQSLVDWNGRKVTPQWLKQEATQIRTVRAVPNAEPDPARRTAMRELADRMDQAASDGLAAIDQADYDGDQYKKLPDTAEFGPLRGMVVHNQIADDITGTVNFVKPDNWFDKVFGDRQSVLTKAMSYWKMAKVPFNPPSQVRNVVSNMILLNLSGVPIHRVGPQMIAAARDMAADGKYYQIAKKYGVGHGTFSEQELYAITDELKRLDYGRSTEGWQSWRAVWEAMNKAGKKVLDWYQLAEVWGKVAKIKHAMEHEGMTEQEAVRAANKWLFDYSEVPQWVRRARQSPIGYPFMTFTYKVLPLMAEVAAKHPTRLLPYVAMSALVPVMTAAMNDIEQDDPEKLRKALPKALQRWNDMYLLPWKDDEGRWQFINIGYFMPWQMPVDIIRNLGQAGIDVAEGNRREAITNVGEAVGGTNILSNPLFNITAAITTGVDPFTKRPIADKRDTPREQIMDILGYVWGLAAPSLVAPYGAAGQLYSKETGSGVNRFGEPTNTYGQIVARSIGLNTYPVIPDAQRARNIQQLNREIQDVRARMTYSLRDKSLTPEQRRTMTEDFREEIRDRTRQLQKYVRESQPSPRLEAATARP